MNLIIDPELEKCLPPLDAGRSQWIKEQMITNGYESSYPIIVWKERNVVVDGHHRYKACLELGIEPITNEVSFESMEDALLYAYEHQDNRRNLLPSQTAIVGTKRLLLKERIDARKRQASSVPAGTDSGRSAEVIAKKLRVGKGTIDRVIAVIDANEPDLEQMIINGELKAETGDLFIKHTDQKQRKELLNGGPSAIKNYVKSVRQKVKTIGALKQARKDASQEVQEYKQYVQDVVGDAPGEVCIIGPRREMWCADCKWGFDVFRPLTITGCPYCGGKNFTERDAKWYPGKKEMV